MRHKMQGLGFVCAITGISGIAGAIELGTGMMQSAILFLSGAFILYRGRSDPAGACSYIIERIKKNNKKYFAER